MVHYYFTFQHAYKR